MPKEGFALAADLEDHKRKDPKVVHDLYKLTGGAGLSPHTHPRSEITDFWSEAFWANITDKPGTFTPSTHALVGAKHTASGLTIGHVVRASGATAFAWAQLQHGDLGGVTANLHHNQLHEAEHEVGGGDLVHHDSLTGFVAGEHFLQSAITTVGTIGTGVWQGTPIANAYIAGINQNLLTSSSPTFVKATLTQATGTPPLTISSQTLVNNLNSDLWDDKHLPALESDKFLSNVGGILKWVAMGAGEYHNLLSVAHPDTVAGSVAQGDIITGQSADVSASSIKNAGLGANVAGAGADWQNPTNIYGSDNSRATVALDADGESDYLRATTFGFTVPSNATIVGIKAEIELSRQYAVPEGTIVDSSVKIVKAGSEQGDQKASVTSWPTSDTYFEYGGEADLWGLGWTYSDINASNFGVSIKALEYSGTYGATARVDHVRITVYYTIPGYAWTQLAKGTDGYILKLVSGYPAWADPGAVGPHASSHEVGGGDLVSHDDLTDFVAGEHFLQSAIVAVGTIGTGIWQGTAIGWTYVSKTGSDLTDLATRQHAGLTNITSDQHHPQSHTLASHSTKAHSELSDAPENAHHAKLHASTHSLGQPDVVNHDNLAGFVAGEHFLQSAITTVGTIGTGVWQGTAIANAYIAGIDQNLLQASEPTFSRLTLSSNPSAGDQAVAREYIESRLQNLTTNGSGLMGDNYNFTAFTFDQVETHGGMGSFKHIGAYANKNADEYIPIDGEKFYRFALWAMSGDTGGGNFNPANKQYAGLIPYDIDSLIVYPYYYSKVSGSTDTTLAADLDPGDPTITLTNATGWYEGATGHSRNIIWYGYENSFGYTYPNYTYSRTDSGNYSDFRTNGAWAQDGIVGNVITLRENWPGPAVPAGTAVRNNKSGGTYKYIVLSNFTVPNAWTRYEGFIGGWDVNGSMATNLFPYGTAFVRLMFLCNYTGGTDPTNIIRWSDLWFSEMSIKNLENHASRHHTGGADLVNHDSLTGFVAGEHFLQSAITTVGTIGTGVWQGTAIANAYVAGINQNLLTSSSPTFVKATLTQTTGIPPLTITSPTLVNNLNVDLWDDQHLPALESGKFLTNVGGVLQWVAVAPGEFHNLLSVAHPDTVTGSPVQGDIITSQSADVSSNSVKNAGLGVNVAGAGTDWQNPTYIYGSENNRATAPLSADATSDYLRATTFGFSIPSTATIVGIKAEIELSRQYAVPEGTIVDYSVKIVKAGAEGGTEKGTMTSWPTSDTYFVYGGPSDLWGLGWTYSDINAANFGVSIKAQEYSGEYSATARVDHIRITVYYTISGFAWKRLAKGSDGYILKLASGYPVWATAPAPGIHDIITGHSDSGLTIGHVIRATGATAFAWQQLQHGDLGGVSINQHHAQSHTLASHSTKAHSELTGVTANLHHNQLHEAEHEVGGGDLVHHDSLTGFVANEHINHGSVSMIAGSGLSGGGTIVANRTFNLGLLTAAWDAGSYQIRALKFQSDQATGTAPFIVASTTKVINLNADFVDGENASAIVTNARVKAHFPDTIANILSNHNVAIHNALDITELGTVSSGVWQGTAIGWTYVSKTGSNLTDLATRQHAGLTNVTSDQHHAQNHASRHHVAGADLVNHDSLTGFVANEHINHGSVSMIAGSGLSGGGTIAASRTFNLGLLTANWDAGNYQIRASRFYSDVATGTIPFVVTSTTKCTNLNVDWLRGLAPSSAAGNNTIVVRTGSGYIYCNWLNTTSGETTDNPTHYFYERADDSFLRQSTPANFVYQLGQDGLLMKSGGTMTSHLYLADHGAPAVAMATGVCYGTGAPPAASSTPIGTLYIKHAF